MQLDVDRGLLASGEADPGACFIGKPLLCRLIVAAAVGCDRARCSGVEVTDGHDGIAKGCAGLVRHHAGKALGCGGKRNKSEEADTDSAEAHELSWYAWY
jgi:hypothetical protein